MQMRKLIEAGYESLGERPVFLGETGIPMDMKCVVSQVLSMTRSDRYCSNGEAFKTEDFTWQAKMMDALMTGLERNLVGFSYVSPFTRKIVLTSSLAYGITTLKTTTPMETSGMRKTSRGSRTNAHESPLRHMPRPMPPSTRVLAYSSPSCGPTQRKWQASRCSSTTKSTPVPSRSRGSTPSRSRLVQENPGKPGRLTSPRCAATHPSPPGSPSSSSLLTG